VQTLGVHAAEQKMQRVTAYRQLQAVSHMTVQCHGRTIDDYDVPDANLKAVASQDERRVTIEEEGVNVAYIVDKVKRTMKRVLPQGLEVVPLLILLLDQGSVGAAGSGFCDHLGKLILMKWEKYTD